MELEDLPPHYREQAERQLEQRKAKKTPKAAQKTAPAGLKFESRGEEAHYLSQILPRIQTGEIVKVTQHVAFLLLPAKVYDGIKLPAARYTPDFLVEYADGSMEAVEIKSKFTRQQQRDYIYRRRLFIDLIAEPRGWKFTEIVTADSRKELALQSREGRPK